MSALTGKPPFQTYDTDLALYSACMGYFKWAEDNPLWEDKVFCSKGEILHTSVSKGRMFLLEEMCTHIGVGRRDWGDTYRKKFPVITDWAETVIYSQKVTGAAANLFNATVVVRSAGLKESVQQEVTGAEGKDLFPDFDPTKLSTEALKEILEARGGRSDS